MQDETVWRPRDGAFRDSNAGRLARRLGVEGGYDDLEAASIADLVRFWDAVVARSRHRRSPSRTRRCSTTSAGPVVAAGSSAAGSTSASACVERCAGDPASAGREPSIWEGEDGTTRALDVRRARARDRAPRRGPRRLGVGQGDAVGLLLPMVPEAVAALYACAALGALAVPIFSGFSAAAVASRLQDAGATALITCDAFPRRGRPVPVKETADARGGRVADAPPRGRRAPARASRSRGGGPRRLVATSSSPAEPATLAPTQVESEHPVLLGYTSGTTGTAEGRGARARRVPGQDRRRGRATRPTAARRPRCTG